MVSLELHFTPEAKLDIQAIWRYSCEQWDVTQADMYLSEMTEAMNVLCDFPLQGKRVDTRTKKARYKIFRQHYIFYEAWEHKIVILAVIHSQSDILHRLSGKPFGGK